MMNPPKKQKVLVTGGAGFIGSHVADGFLAEGFDVHIVDNLSSGSRENIPADATFYHLDLRDPRLEHIIAEEQFPFIVHHAAQLDVRRSVADPGFDADINITGTLKLLEAGRQNGLSRFVFASTGGAIYGESAAYPQPETTPTHPESPYGIAKLSIEHYLRFYEQVHGISSVILRYANVYGPRQGSYGEAGVIAIFLKKILAGERPIIFGNGLQTRDYVYVKDVVLANKLALDAQRGGTYNVGTAVETNVVDLVDKLSRHMDANIKPVFADKRAGEVFRSALSYDLIARELGWNPTVDLDSGLIHTIQWFNSRIQNTL